MACALLVFGLIGGWVYHKAVSIYGTPSCSWPLRVRGTATGQQAGLVRCYLKAVAEHNTGQLTAVARNIPAAHITRSDFRYSQDARGGVATAIFAPNPIDSTYVYVKIRFADGTVDDSEGIINMVSMGGPSVWRMDIGS